MDETVRQRLRDIDQAMAIIFSELSQTSLIIAELCTREVGAERHVLQYQQLAKQLDVLTGVAMGVQVVNHRDEQS